MRVFSIDNPMAEYKQVWLCLWVTLNSPQFITIGQAHEH